ncbi:MAG: GNAT family N-acetyltransferase [Oscillospiraceae bacterium]|nr:GNAT family N-acetyltransferase [Oscillospiraceae bacterium]
MACVFTIRAPKPDEYEQVISCITEARGEKYYSEKFYDFSYLQSGEHEIFAAFDANGEIAGITGLSCAPFEKEKTMLSLLNVRPSFTGSGIGTRLLDYSIDKLESRGVKSVKGHVITHYTSIQTVLEKFNLLPAGFLQAVRDNNNIAGPSDTDSKNMLAIYVRNFNVKKTKPLFIHRSVAALADKVYTDLGVSLHSQQSGKCGKINTIGNIYDSHDDVLFIQVKKCSCDLAQNLDAIASKYRSSNNLTELVFLNLCDPSAIYGYESITNNGYKFCGFDPLGEYENAVFFKGKVNQSKPAATECLEALFDEIEKVNNNAKA